MTTIVNELSKHASRIPSHWREEAAFRLRNKSWLGYSQMIAMKMLDRMEELNITPKALAEELNCSEQYISSVLKGSENLSLETISKIEKTLQIQIICK